MTNDQVVKQRKRLINTYKVCVGCCICGYNKNPAALCFDHVEQYTKHDDVKNGYSKRSSAGGMYRLYSKKYSTDVLISEIKKCRVICHNCHMENTHKKPTYILKTLDKLDELYLELLKTDGI